MFDSQPPMKTESIQLNIETAAREFGVSRETLRRGLKALGIELGRGKTYDLRTLHRATAGDAAKHRAELLRWQAHREKQAARREDGETVSMAEARAMVAKLFQPMREQLLELPNAWCARVNPSDPALAREALGQWVDQCLAAAREAEVKEAK